MALTVKRIEKLMRAGVPGRHTDGDVKGLMLCIEGKSSAHWLLRYQRDKAIRHMGLGSARDLGLAAARERALRERERLAAGLDPLALRKAERDAAVASAAKRHTFREAAERFYEAKEKGWTNARHRDEFLSSLRRWVYPVIGDADVASVGKDEVLRVLEQRVKGGGKFWDERAVTADRTRNRIERVLDYAEAREWRTEGTPNPARWKGFLENLLAKPRDVAPVQNLRAVPYGEVPGLMTVLAADTTVGAQALRFIVMTACRIGEALGTAWDEIDLETAEWVIPKQRMKARRPHRVPLSPQVLALLRGLPREDGNKYVFISPRSPGTAVTETTVTRVLRDAGRSETVHGFRSAFKTWAGERTRHHSVEIEVSLAHSVGNAVEQAYTRGDLFEKRCKLMEHWAAYCMSPPMVKSDKVVAIGAAR
jgi:integrase